MTVLHFLLRPDLVIVQLAAVPARAKADCSAAFLRRVREMDSRRAVAAVSFAVRFSPGTGPFAVVPFCLCRSPICLATAGFVPAADRFVPAGSGFAAGPGSVGLAVFASDLACSFCPFAVALGKGMAVAVLFCSLTHQSSF